MTDNSKIGDEFEQNKLSEVCSVNPLFEFIPYLGVVSQIFISDLPCKHQQTTDGAYLADFGIDIRVVDRISLMI